MASNIVKSGFTRAWLIKNGVGPLNPPVYFGQLKIDDPSQSFGDIENIETPDPARFNRFIVVGSIAGEEERASFGLSGRYPMDKSRLLEFAKLRCQIDVQAHIGNCKDPRDYNQNWEKMIIFSDGRISTYSLENLAALDSSERAAVNEAVELSSEDFYEVLRLSFAEIAPTIITEILQDVSTYGVAGCEDCDEIFEGCETVFSVQDGDGAANPPMIIFSTDSFATESTDFNTELLFTDTISDATFVGTSYVMISPTADTANGVISWISIEDAVRGVAGWQSPATNPFVTPNIPRFMYSESPRDTLIVGDNGYIWSMGELGTVTELDAGITTTEDLLSVHMLDTNRAIVGGANNLLMTTLDGGGIWTIIATTPTAEAANGLTVVYIREDLEWIIGYDSGTVYATKDGGLTWTQKVLPIVPTVINDLTFSTDAVGVLAVTTAGGGSILRTTDGGYSWKALPDGLGTLPSSTAIFSVAMCGGDANLVYGAGQNTTDGILIKGINA